MAFRKTCLEAIGGFDPRFRIAGDDVDVCWRLQERGWTLGFHPAAMVWHHRRDSLRAYWKQQIGYGRAEAMLERKWPEKYNGPGHVRWAGRMYGHGLTRILRWRRAWVYHGVWGAAPFQSLYEPAPSLLSLLPQMPEWHLMTAVLAVTAGLGIAYRPLRLAVPLLGGALVLPVAQACWSATRASFPEASGSVARAVRRVLTAGLHLLQPRGHRLIRVRAGPDIPERGPMLALALAGLAVAAFRADATLAGHMLGVGAVLPVLHIIEQCMAAMATIRQAVARLRPPRRA